MTDAERAFQVAMPRPTRIEVQLGPGHTAFVFAYTADQVRAIWNARGEADARVCDGQAAEAKAEADKNTFLTSAGKSAYVSFAVGATACATAIRGLKC
jgi:hypothetical protein